MKRSILSAFLLGVVLCFTSCVELDGQRLSFFYHAAKDELRILLFYDGIHDNAKKGDHGSEQVPVFTRDGDVMILDWIGQVKMAGLRMRAAQTQPTDYPAEQTLLKLFVASTTTAPVAHYRDADGRIGAVQFITIGRASNVITAVNGCINESLIKSDPQNWKSTELVRTGLLCVEAAKKNWQWLQLDGHSLVLHFPVHPREWAAAKTAYGALLVEGLWQQGAKTVSEADAVAIRRALQGLSAAAISYDESGGEVRLRLGDAKTPNTLRMAIRDEYEPSLETVVKKEIPTELQEDLVAYLLRRKMSGPPPGIEDIAKWGPPEEVPRALLSALPGPKMMPGAPDLVEARLRSWAVAWNKEQGIPPAPEWVQGAEVPVEAWKEWLKKMERFPEPPAGKPAAPATQPVP